MNSKRLIAFFILLNVLFIVTHINNRSKQIKLSYEKQRLEQHKETTHQKMNELTEKIHHLKNPKIIKNKALELGFKKTNLNQIKTVRSDDVT